MQLLGRLLDCNDQSTSLTFWRFFTGCDHPRESSFELAVIVYRGIHGTAPRYLSDLLHRLADIASRRRLRSSTSSELVIPLSWIVTVGDRSSAVAGPRLWNTLPASAPSLLMF